MDYTIPVSKEIHGDAIPLRHVAEAMARKAATGFGKRRLHPATLETVRPQYETDLLKAARNGTLKVCDIRGNSGTVEKLISTTEGLPQELGADTKALLALHIKAKHLAEWAEARGDSFTVVDVPVSAIEFGPDRDDGTKEYRGYVCDAFDLFGEHGYFDIPPSGGVVIEFDDSDFEAGDFVRVAAVAKKITEYLLSKGSPNKLQAERDAWPHVLTGVTLKALHPVNPATMQVLSVDHCTDGMIRFDELVAWGRKNNIFEFKKRAAATESIPTPNEAEKKIGAGKTAISESCKIRKGGRPKGQQGELLQKIIDALTAWAMKQGESFDSNSMPGQVGNADVEGSFHWLCAKLYPSEFRKGNKAFKGYRAGRCVFRAYAKKSDIYSRASPHIAQTLGVTLDAYAGNQKPRKAA